MRSIVLFLVGVASSVVIQAGSVRGSTPTLLVGVGLAFAALLFVVVSNRHGREKAQRRAGEGEG